MTAGVLLPVRRVRWTTAGLAAFQVSHDEFDCPSCEPPAVDTATLAATQFGWSFSSARAFGYSISAEQGASAAVTTELRRSGEGGSGTAGAATVDVRGYARVLPRHGVLAVRAAGATTWGDSSHSPGLRCWRLGRANAWIRFRLPRDQPAAGLRQLGPVRLSRGRLQSRLPVPARVAPARLRHVAGDGAQPARRRVRRRWQCLGYLLSRRRLPPVRRCRAVVGHCSCRSLPADDHRWRGVAARSVREGRRMGGVCAGRACVLIRGELPVLAGRWLRIVAA